ncbi:hypothetical protein [Streptomyces sp. NPDC002994]|uniref:hypothetical protein n=1 Tax=Streptomyces sp. NPDC002994 TaxID=3154441 RepID=UPI0033BA20CE
MITELADRTETALADLDTDYRRLYGADLTHWSRGVRGEYLDLLAGCTKRAKFSEHLPVRPRKASAGRRRRHRTQLGWRLNQIAPTAETVLLTPVWTDATGTVERVYVVTARDGSGRSLKLPQGGSRRITALVQGAHPEADWARPQTWRTSTARLTVWSPPSPDFLATEAAGYIVSLDQLERRRIREAMPADWAERIRWAACLTAVLLTHQVAVLETQVNAARRAV